MPDSRISMPSVRRFPSYLRILMQNREAGHKTISATQLAEELGLTPIQVRKDLASTGIEGRPKVGFSIDELISSITHALGWDNLTEALIVGAGNLGSALAAYDGFSAYGLRIVAIFDKDPSKIGKRIGDLTVLPVDGINQYIKNKMSEICKNYSCKLITPPIELCTDNGIMVANAALERYNIGLFDTLDIAPKARWELEDLKK